MRVLVTGATGQFAGLVVPALVSRSVEVRAFVMTRRNRARRRTPGPTRWPSGTFATRPACALRWTG
jgi:uncharacterized protein YbjT (DUF2867 family)